MRKKPVPPKGYKRSLETRRKISEANKGRKMSQEARKRMSEAQQRRIREGGPRGGMPKGSKLTQEHKQKISAGLQKAHQNNPELRKRLGPAKGYKRSLETRKRMSEGRKKYFEKHPEALKKFLGYSRPGRIKKGQRLLPIGFTHSEETAQLISDRAKAFWRDNPMSQERRAHISRLHTGKKHSAETRAKMSASHRGKIVWPETRAKMSAILKARWESGEMKAIHAKAMAGIKERNRLKKLNN